VIARLSLETLTRVPPDMRPPIDPRETTVGIVHLGLGAFHRAHQAVYTQTAMARSGDAGWGICGVTQRSDDVVRQLEPQDNLYGVLTRGPTTSAQICAGVRAALFAQADTEAFLDAIAAPTTRVVTLTVTEKGYRHDPATGRLRDGDTEIQADAAGRDPRTVVGQLVRGLQRRAARDGGPITVVCCDNLPANGRTLATLVGDFCALLGGSQGAAASDWIDGFVRFPSTMVDRIVPATTSADRDDAAALLGVDDHGTVVAEPFSQWVIEDRFAGARPGWEEAGAILTSDVTPYEKIKLRLLNGSHSALAYIGVLAGRDYVSDLVADDDMRVFVRALMDVDVTPTLAVPDSFDLDAYKSSVLERFANAAIRHRTAQIAMDGTQKLPQRLLGTIRDRLQAGAQPRFAITAVAAWARFVSARRADDGRALAVDDPLSSRLAELTSSAQTPSLVVERLLQLTSVFGDLADDGTFRTMLTDAVEMFTAHGALATVRAVLDDA
jgi:fructuronate reductase